MAQRMMAVVENGRVVGAAWAEKRGGVWLADAQAEEQGTMATVRRRRGRLSAAAGLESAAQQAEARGDVWVHRGYIAGMPVYVVTEAGA